MSYLKEVMAYKRNLTSAIVSNRDIVQILSTANTQATDDLLNDNIYPFLYIPDTATSREIYICVDIDVPRVKNKVCEAMQVYIDIICHKMKNLTGKGYTNIDMLQYLIAKELLQRAEEFGLGDLDLLSSSGIVKLPSDYVGRELVFTATNIRIAGCDE